MADEERFKVKLFDGCDFDNWLFRLRIALDEKELVQWIENDALVAKNAEGVTELQKTKINKEDKACKSMIVRRVADSHLEYIKDKETAYQIIASLHETFQRASIASEIGIRKRMLLMKCGVDERLQEYFLRFDKCLRELKSCGGDTNDRMAVVTLLVTLPSKYDMVVTALETMDPKSLTMELVRSRLLDAESKRSNSNVIDGVRDNNNVAMYSDRKTKCYYCKQFGHRKFECPKLKKTDNRNQQHREQNKYQKQNMRKANIADDEISFFADTVSHALECHENTNIKWYIDSGASERMTNDESLFIKSKILNKPISIGVAKSGVSIFATKIGMIRGTTLVNGFKRNCCINDVLYVKDLKCNLFSISRLEKAGFDVMFIQGQVYVRKDDIELIVGKRSGNLYEFEMGILRESLVVDRVDKNLEEESKMEAATSCEVKNKTNSRELLGGKKKNQASMELWHRRMGHLNSNDVRRLSSMVDGIGLLNNDLRGTCEPCNFGKQRRKPFNNSGGMRSSRVLELIHTDVCGPINPPTWDGNRFIVTFVDDFTHFTMVYLMKKKS